jgi:hypothetical protein
MVTVVSTRGTEVWAEMYYRIYVLTNDGDVHGPPTLVDVAATKKAKQL